MLQLRPKALAGAVLLRAMVPLKEAPEPDLDGKPVLILSGAMDPIVPPEMRAYKKESELEVWKKGRDGKYALLKTYPICRWSGQLGPKVLEGDRQAPEGFYTVTPAQMNPNSSPSSQRLTARSAVGSTPSIDRFWVNVWPPCRDVSCATATLVA